MVKYRKGDDFMEGFKVIKGYEDYSISSLGVIMRGDKEIKSFLLPNGYARVNIYNNGKAKQFSVHRLVALAFIGDPPCEKMVVNHKNSIRNDNRLDNLEWVTQSQNVKQGYDSGFADKEKVAKQLAGVRHLAQAARRKRVQLTNVKTGEVFVFNSLREAAKNLSISEGGLGNAFRGKNKTCGGYTVVAAQEGGGS